MYCGFIKIQMGDRSRCDLFQHTFPSPTKNDATKTRVKLIRNNYLRRPGIVSHSKLDGVVQFTDQLVHVVETRFMQSQSQLLELGFARLALFEAFCLPSMLSQTNPNFLWIIRADPKLHPSIVDRLRTILGGRSNFILIGSNHNPEGFGRVKPKLPFQSFLRFDNVTPSVWNGNISLLEEAYDRSAAGAVLLETRLDSDDGVNIHFIEMVQTEARKNLIIDNNDNKNSEYDDNLWRLWCIESRIEWHPLNPYPDTPEIVAATNDSSFPEGYLVYYSEKGCSTPGLTFGYGQGASRDSVDRSLGIDHLRHDEIAKKIRKCKKNSTDIEVECVSRLSELTPGAARARTTTSAGMNNVITGDKEIDKRNVMKRLSSNKRFMKQFTQQQTLWASMKNSLSISVTNVQSARSIIVNRMKEIAADNLKGQCTGGHSCKNGTKAVLERLAD